MTGLATLHRGLADPVHGAQGIFRTLLTAMSRPGTVQALPREALAGLEPPGIGRGLAGVLLTLLDAETSAWLDPALQAAQMPGYLRFHTGVRLLDGPQAAAFALTAAAHASPRLWTDLASGTDEAPQGGSTLVVEVLSFDLGVRLVLTGPGIEHRQPLQAEGLAPDFWRARQALEPEFPRGVDLILCCGDAVAALPRSTRLQLDG